MCGAHLALLPCRPPPRRIVPRRAAPQLAALPNTSEADMRRALHFVVVGGGPTGVEFSGTLSDFLRSDLRRRYPELVPYVSVTLLNSAQTILSQFDKK